MTTSAHRNDDLRMVVAEWLYERDWKGRRWPSEEAMRSRPTFAQLLTGETCLPPDYGKYEVQEAQRRLAEADEFLAVVHGGTALGGAE